jgi:chromosome segregation ATPase
MMKEQNELIASLIEQIENYKSLNEQLNNIQDLSSTILDGFKEEMSRIQGSMNSVLQSISVSNTKLDEFNNDFTQLRSNISEYSAEIAVQQQKVSQSADDAIQKLTDSFENLQQKQIDYLHEQLNEMKSLLDTFTLSLSQSQEQTLANLKARLTAFEDQSKHNVQTLQSAFENSHQALRNEFQATLKARVDKVLLLLGLIVGLLILGFVGLFFTHG